MLYSTIVQRDETGLNALFAAAREFEDANALEALIACKFDRKTTEKALNLVRMCQCRLNNESIDLVEFSEHFIEAYATDHNECFRIAEKLLRKIGTTITGSMKVFRRFCPVVRRKMESGKVVPVLDYSRLRSREFYGQFFGAEVYIEPAQTLLHEMATFFYHLITTLKVCKDMIAQEEKVKGDISRLKEIFEKSCEEALHGVREVFDTFGHVKLVSDEELAERRRNARPMKEWLARDYHAHDIKWMKREAYFRRLASGSQYGLDEKASVLWTDNPEWGKKVCDIIPKLDNLHIPFKHSKKAEGQGKKGTFDARSMAYMLKWSRVSRVSDDGRGVVNEANERQFYIYLQEHYSGDFLLPTWQAVCGERRFCYANGISAEEMAKAFAKIVPEQADVA